MKIKIDEQEFELKCSALVPRNYRFATGRDFFRDMKILIDKYLVILKTPETQFSVEELTIFENVLWAMIYDENIPSTPERWLDSVKQQVSIYEYLTYVVATWYETLSTTSKAAKKGKPTARESTGALFMLRCSELGLSDETLKNMTIGMVYDLIIEKNNDDFQYPYLASQEDIDKL